MAKSWYTSKTLWINVVAILAIAVQGTTSFVIDATLQLELLAAINVALRLITNEPVEWSSE